MRFAPQRVAKDVGLGPLVTVIASASTGFGISFSGHR